MNNHLEMLTAREQLMEDIDCIITEYFREQLMEDIDCIITEYFQGVDDAELNEVTRILCDAVCRNFPSN